MALAQRNISGVVTDENNVALPGVNIIVKGTSNGTSTDLDGKYTISANIGDTLSVTMIGMETKEVAVGVESTLNFTLYPETEQLDEVVVIGYGTVRKSDLTGSVSTVKATDLVKVTSVNPVQSLQGKVSGLQVISQSGAPGATSTVRIRGVGTFNISSPIYVVDGMILDDISFLNSADIASVEVLKDASATAIYGSRGANGVIIVTTKSGSIEQQKAAFNYSGEYGIQNVAKKIDLLNGREFATIVNEIRPGSYNNVDVLPNTDWQDLIFNTAPMQSHQISVSGATQVTRYYVGLGYFDQEGIVDKSSYKRVTLQLNNTYLPVKKLTLGNNITVSPYYQEVAPNVTYAVYRAQPLLVPYYSDGSYAVVYNVGNPLASLDYSNDLRKGIRGVGNIFAELQVIQPLRVKSSFGVDAAYNKGEKFTPAFTVYNPDGTASQQQNVLSDILKGNSDALTWLWENTLSFNKEFGKSNIDAVAGFTMQNSSSERLTIPGENVFRDSHDFWYINPSYVYDPAFNVNKTGDITNEVDANQFYSLISYLFRVNYTFAEKYIATVTFRRDGSSKFSSSNRYSNFPSFALGWNISRENFMKEITLINNLKIRGSWGIIGNEKITYYDRFARVDSRLVAVFGTEEVLNSAASYGKSGNPDLKWESTTQTDIGLEIGILENRLTGEFDFYNRQTDDILVELSTPGYLGNGQGQKVRFNAGSVLNRGFEGKINWRRRINNFSYNVGVLGASVYNKVLEIGGNSGIDSVLFGGALENGISVTQSRVGLPIGAFYGYKTDGIFQSQAELDAYPHDSQAGVGDFRFVDTNNDNIIDGNDRTYLGSPIPEFLFGFTLELTFKGFDFSLDIQGQTGNKIFNGKEAVKPDPYNFEKHVLDRWRGPNTSNTEPRPSFGGYNYTPSDYFIQDGSFARLRSLILGYTIPKSITSKIQLENLRVYIKGTNLYTLTNYTGYSPEIGGSSSASNGINNSIYSGYINELSNTSVLSNGIDNGIYPITAVYSFGINLTF